MSKTVNAYIPNFRGLSGILLCGIFLSAFGIIFGGESIKAQMEGLYDETNDEVAGINSLMSAAANNDIDGVRFFSKAGATLVNQKNIGGATALHIAAREKNLPIMKVLIENGANIDAADNEGWTPIMRSALVGDSEAVNFLLDKNAQVAGLNSARESVIFHATMSDCDKCLGYLFEKFNFIKLMNPEILTEQLNNSYAIARNRDNKITQDLISVYLDRVVKMTSLLESDLGEASGEDKIVAIGSATGEAVVTKFKFNGSEVAQIDVVEPVQEISIQKNDVPSVTTAPVLTGVSVIKEESLNSSNPKILYKFSKSREEKSEENKQKIIEMISQKDVPSSEEKPVKASEVIFRFKKSEDQSAQKVEALVVSEPKQEAAVQIEEQKSAEPEKGKKIFKFIKSLVDKKQSNEPVAALQNTPQKNELNVVSSEVQLQQPSETALVEEKKPEDLSISSATQPSEEKLSAAEVSLPIAPEGEAVSQKVEPKPVSKVFKFKSGS